VWVWVWVLLKGCAGLWACNISSLSISDLALRWSSQRVRSVGAFAYTHNALRNTRTHTTHTHKFTYTHIRTHIT